jgi:hypothetical protein
MSLDDCLILAAVVGIVAIIALLARLPRETLRREAADARKDIVFLFGAYVAYLIFFGVFALTAAFLFSKPQPLP